MRLTCTTLARRPSVSSRFIGFLIALTFQPPSHLGSNFLVVGTDNQTVCPTWKILDALSSYAVFCCSAATARLASTISRSSASLACRWSKYVVVSYANGLKTSGICGCRPYRRRNNEIPVDKWTAVGYPYRAKGRWHSQAFCFSTYTLRSCKSVWLKRSTIPSPWGWYAVVCDLVMPKMPNAFSVCRRIMLSKFRAWSEWSISGGKGFATAGCPNEWCTLLCLDIQGCCNVCEVADVPAVVQCQVNDLEYFWGIC